LLLFSFATITANIAKGKTNIEVIKLNVAIVIQRYSIIETALIEFDYRYDVIQNSNKASTDN